MLKLISFSLVLASCIQKSSNDNLPPKLSELNQGSTDLVEKKRFKDLLKEMGLVDAPEQPTSFLSDDTFRNTMADELTKQNTKLQCETIRFLNAPFLQRGNTVDVYQVTYKLNIIPETLQAFMIVPKNKTNLSMLLYAHSGWEKPFTNNEVYDLLSGYTDKFVTFVPALRDEDFATDKTAFKSKRMTYEQAWISDADRLVGLGLCVGQFKDTLVLADGKTLTSKFAPTGQYKLPSVTVSGTGSGAATAMLAVARSGAMAYQSKSSEAQWLRTDCSFVANPLLSLYGAENRLLLYNLVSGQTEESKYAQIPGLTDLRKELFFRWRQGQIDLKTVAQQMLFRDPFAAAPFVNFGLKNYRKPADAKGNIAGGLLVAVENGRTDFTVNQSRIYANIAATIQSKVVANLNGIEFSHREFFTDMSGLDSSYVTAFSPAFFKTAGTIIPQLFTIYPSDVKGNTVPQQQYDRFIQGRAYDNSEGKLWFETMGRFLDKSCLSY